MQTGEWMFGGFWLTQAAILSLELNSPFLAVEEDAICVYIPTCKAHKWLYQAYALFPPSPNLRKVESPTGKLLALKSATSVPQLDFFISRMTRMIPALISPLEPSRADVLPVHRQTDDHYT